MEKEIIHAPLHPAYYELERGERNFICINPDGYAEDGKVQKSAHTMHTINGKVENVPASVSYQMEEMKIGDSLVSGVTIIVRIN